MTCVLIFILKTIYILYKTKSLSTVFKAEHLQSIYLNQIQIGFITVFMTILTV